MPTPKSQTRSVAGVKASGASLSQFGVVFNISQPGNNPEVSLNQYSVDFYSAAGAEPFVASFKALTVQTSINSGTDSAGHVFNITFEPFKANSFSDAIDRIRIQATEPIAGTSGPPMSFNIKPEPSGWMLASAPGAMTGTPTGFRPHSGLEKESRPASACRGFNRLGNQYPGAGFLCLACTAEETA